MVVAAFFSMWSGFENESIFNHESYRKLNVKRSANFYVFFLWVRAKYTEKSFLDNPIYTFSSHDLESTHPSNAYFILLLWYTFVWFVFLFFVMNIMNVSNIWLWNLVLLLYFCYFYCWFCFRCIVLVWVFVWCKTTSSSS